MLWRLLFIALIGGAQFMTSDRCPASTTGQRQCRCPDSAGDLINTTNSVTLQSSVYTAVVLFTSVRATDGNETACASTKDEPGNHWWRIDLPDIYDISWVSIYNDDGDNTDITGAQIHIGNSRENNGTNNKMCAKITHFNKGQWNDFKCTEQVSGRYVNVSFPGTKALVLCEVKIYGRRKDLINTANSITSQSSDYINENDVSYYSGRATDGNKTQCAHTKYDEKPWWRIDLPDIYDISWVSIYNDDGDNTDITGAQIHIGNSHWNSGTNNKMCAEITHFNRGQWNHFKCTEQVSGRYVNVSFPGTKALVLCEVKIYGRRKDLINTAIRYTSQSSVYTDNDQVSYSSVRATDGDEKLCAKTNDDQNPWWSIYLLGVYDISSVSIYNHNELNTDITGAQIHIGNFHWTSGTNNKMCAEITHFNRGQWNDFKCTERVSGRYVFVSFPGQKALVLCEVKIYSKKRDLINTAIRYTSQSSVYTDNDQVSYFPVRATDGDEKLCAKTNDDQNPWWSIDLLGVYDISWVSIYNHNELNTDITGAQIHIGNFHWTSGTNNKMCAKITNFSRGQWNDFKCTERVSGRYVTVSFPGEKTLVLCEVKIYGRRKGQGQCTTSGSCPDTAGGLINTKTSVTSQSSNYTDVVPFTSVRATDGDETACASTKAEQGNHWWRIDLLGVYNISCVSIYNQKGNKINVDGAQIHIRNSRGNNGTNNKMCAKITNFIEGEWNDFKCTKQVSGRYVTVSLPGHIGLILCEVEIYGKKKASPFELIKKKKTWEHALEYCRERNMDLATILDEDDQTLAELEARRAGTTFVWLGLHYTCILEVWFWVADYRLEFNRWAPGEKTGDCDRSAVMSRAEGHQWFSKSDYDKFHFICQKF